MRTWFSSTGSRKSQEKSFGNKVLCAKRFARQRWRAWIETRHIWFLDGRVNGFARQRWRAWIETFVSTGRRPDMRRFARQRWRAWIETCAPRPPRSSPQGFARQRWRAWIETSLPSSRHSARHWFARQRWRAWIETTSGTRIPRATTGSPVSDGGRGLKPVQEEALPHDLEVRPSAMAGVD